MIKLEMAIPDTALIARACSLADMAAVNDPTLKDEQKMALLASVCTFDEHGARQWGTMEAAFLAPWPIIAACNNAAMIINGLTTDPELELGN